MSEEKQADTHKRKRESHSDDTHLRVVLLHSEGYSYSEIVAATHLPEGTVKTIIHRSQQRHSTHKKHKGGNHKAVWGDDVRKLVCDMQSADPAASLLDLQHAVDICLPVTPSCVNTIWRMLQTADFTTKKLYPIPEPSEEFISNRKGSKKKKTGPKGVTRDIFRSFILTLLDLPLFHSANDSISAPAAASSAPAASPQQFKLVMDNARIHKGDITDIIFSTGHVSQPLTHFILRES